MKSVRLLRIIIIIFLSIFFIVCGLVIGGEIYSLNDIISVILHKIFNFELSESISKSMISIIWDIRLPRVLLSFLVGGMLSVSGIIFQSVLKNPLASSYTIGISSGASLGIGICVIFNIVIDGFLNFTYPIVGFIFSIITVLFVIYLSKKINQYMTNSTIILIGMTISLFLNSILSIMTCIKQESLSNILVWQMGSFSSRGFDYLKAISLFFIVGVIGAICLSREMDILAFSDEMCKLVGIDFNKIKILLLILGSILTGASIASSGIIGFVDLIVPHISRKLFGTKHFMVILSSIFIGGAFMVVFDTIARNIIYPSEIPISVINALFGTPIFCYIFFKSSRRKQKF